MKSRKGFLYALLAVDFFSVLLSWAGLLLIEETTLLEAQEYIVYYWNSIYDFLIGYPLEVFILLSATFIVYYILRLFGIRIE